MSDSKDDAGARSGADARANGDGPGADAGAEGARADAGDAGPGADDAGADDAGADDAGAGADDAVADADDAVADAGADGAGADADAGAGAGAGADAGAEDAGADADDAGAGADADADADAGANDADADAGDAEADAGADVGGADAGAGASAAAGPSGSITVDPLGLGALVTYLGIGVFLVFGFAWVLVPAVAAQNASPCRPLKPKPLTGPAPDFQVQDLAGNPVTLADFAGKFVVLNFWAEYCEPCITEWPQLHRMAERLAGRDDVVVIAMSIDADESRPRIEPFLERMSLTETDVMVLWDPDQKVHKDYGTSQIPDTYFIDESGQLVHAFVNVREWGSPDALHCLDSVAGR